MTSLFVVDSLDKELDWEYVTCSRMGDIAYPHEPQVIIPSRVSKETTKVEPQLPHAFSPLGRSGMNLYDLFFAILSSRVYHVYFQV